MAELEDLKEGEKILFNDRKVPLEVSKVEEDRVLVKGPSGGEYEIYKDDGTLLWSKKGNRRYASYCNDLRKVGEWERKEDVWKHSKTGNEVRIEKNSIGYWNITSEDFELSEEIDLPMYGYNDREEVVKEVEKIVKKHPEGF